jgi:two-component system chemotaxis response regulator CheY
MRSLIVEDEFVSRAKLQKILSTFGECHVAVNGREGLEAFKMALDSGEAYDLVCMDILMPELDGHEALQELRQAEKERGIGGLDHVKVIMTTALKDGKNVMKAFIKGQCEAYLSKPFSKDKLLGELQKLNLLPEEQTEGQQG